MKTSMTMTDNSSLHRITWMRWHETKTSLQCLPPKTARTTCIGDEMKIKFIVEVTYWNYIQFVYYFYYRDETLNQDMYKQEGLSVKNQLPIFQMVRGGVLVMSKWTSLTMSKRSLHGEGRETGLGLGTREYQSEQIWPGPCTWGPYPLNRQSEFCWQVVITVNFYIFN